MASGASPFSPDERWMLYAQQDQRGSDIFLMEEFR
jgi:hypothetical protein